MCLEFLFQGDLIFEPHFLVKDVDKGRRAQENLQHLDVVIVLLEALRLLYLTAETPNSILG